MHVRVQEHIMIFLWINSGMFFRFRTNLSGQCFITVADLFRYRRLILFMCSRGINIVPKQAQRAWLLSVMSNDFCNLSYSNCIDRKWTKWRYKRYPFTKLTCNGGKSKLPHAKARQNAQEYVVISQDPGYVNWHVRWISYTLHPWLYVYEDILIGLLRISKFWCISATTQQNVQVFC